VNGLRELMTLLTAVRESRVEFYEREEARIMNSLGDSVYALTSVVTPSLSDEYIGGMHSVYVRKVFAARFHLVKRAHR
jgi:hypothetical protein